ncbi:ClC family H(+)/Cl(-) exchange transporter [Microaceticoccus formicicus]|uniref:ClC family H(+)/Cl(-) exchange transporter n=1 Tax=Microaceticoccus formicicus TaxID=3118105 RepID=UPI003CD01BD0|nr:ClC family H(+)/Cl(-) exchange transporter [Peptoniphilaceae bacterium AMB_02]
MKSILHYYKHSKSRQFVLDGVIIGIISGFCSVLYRYILHIIANFRGSIFQELNPLKITLWFAFLFIAGLIVHYLIEFEPMSSGSGIPQIQGEMLGVFDTDSKRIIFAKFLGGSLASLAGLSLGREGPSIQIGANAAKVWAKYRKKTVSETNLLMSAGASAGLSAAFNAPISGVIFVLEELHKTYSSFILIPALIAAIVADFVSKNIFGLAPAFALSISEVLKLGSYYHLILLAVLCSITGILFNKSILKAQDLYKKIKLPRPIVLILVFIITGLVGFLMIDITGGGHPLIESLLESNKALHLLILLLVGKTLFTAFSYGSKTQGGIFLPVLVLGALIGNIYFKIWSTMGLLSYPHLPNFIILGMAGVLTAVIRSPILSILLVTEMTGSFSHLLSLSIVSIISYLISNQLKSEPIYESLLHRMIQSFKPEILKQGQDSKTLYTITVPTASRMAGKKIMDLAIPQGVLILTIERHKKELIPRGDTIIKAGDTLHITTSVDRLSDCKKYFNENLSD